MAATVRTAYATAALHDRAVVARESQMRREYLGHAALISETDRAVGEIPLQIFRSTAEAQSEPLFIEPWPEPQACEAQQWLRAFLLPEASHPSPYRRYERIDTGALDRRLTAMHARDERRLERLFGWEAGTVDAPTRPLMPAVLDEPQLDQDVAVDRAAVHSQHRGVA
jgi:hypothetical protein